MTAEEELKRIDNRKVGLDGYTFKEMVWFAEYYAKKQVEAINYSQCSTQLKEKETPTFEKWLTKDINRIELYAKFLDKQTPNGLGNLYREYANEILDNL